MEKRPPAMTGHLRNKTQSRVVFIRHQTEENGLKQGRTTWTCPITNTCFNFLLQNILLQCTLMNTVSKKIEKVKNTKTTFLLGLINSHKGIRIWVRPWPLPSSNHWSQLVGLVKVMSKRNLALTYPIMYRSMVLEQGPYVVELICNYHYVNEQSRGV
jgi:hypothetical protein